MFRGRKLINNFIFSNNHQCNYTKTISRLRRREGKTLLPILIIYIDKSGRYVTHLYPASILINVDFPAPRKQIDNNIIVAYCNATTVIINTGQL